jgi:hypothetical protein
MKKPDPQSFLEKISPAQREQLIDWLADHTYSEACDLVAAPPPDGFGLQVSVPTMCRFYKTHYGDIACLRQDKLNLRGAEQRLYCDAHNESYRENLTHGATLSLQERFYELLSRPVESIDQLKKLVYICRQIQDLRIGQKPPRFDEILKGLASLPLDHVLANFPSAAVPRPEQNPPRHAASAGPASQQFPGTASCAIVPPA